MRDGSQHTPASFDPHPTASDSSVAKNDANYGYAEDGTRSIRDNSQLADLGYRPELRRDFSALETFGVAFSIMYDMPHRWSVYVLPADKT